MSTACSFLCIYSCLCTIYFEMCHKAIGACVLYTLRCAMRFSVLIALTSLSVGELFSEEFITPYLRPSPIPSPAAAIAITTKLRRQHTKLRDLDDFFPNLVLQHPIKIKDRELIHV